MDDGIPGVRESEYLPAKNKKWGERGADKRDPMASSL